MTVMFSIRATTPPSGAISIRMPDAPPLFAGDFSDWLAQMQEALRTGGESDVPCDGCTACCRSSQFVHVEPDETDTLAHIPGELQFPAPGRPGHVVLGYDERGHCPMLTDGGCSIYEHRPRACRTYDCRVLAAAGLDDETKPLITDRVHRWRFGYPAGDDRARHDAVRAAARSLDEQPDAAHPLQVAVRAIERHEDFLPLRLRPRPPSK
jgi:hypothetical protein